MLLQPRPLDPHYLIEVVDLLRRQGYSGVDYHKLGLSLGLSPDTLDDIEKKDKGNARLCLIECLRAWLEQKDNVKSKGVPTYETLIQALREIGQNDVADGLERYFQVPPITPKP
uniref:Death domain-containing protein n=1 Tax=Amphimedon queenslandica TaxID=400682 RepID=A0A1X7SRT1_AMPQE